MVWKPFQTGFFKLESALILIFTFFQFLEEDEAVNEQRLAFEENMSKKESQMKELDRVSKSLSDELKNLQLEIKIKRDSEDQMKQVLKEYEKTISELVADKEREKLSYDEERLRLTAERDQAVEDLRVRIVFQI